MLYCNEDWYKNHIDTSYLSGIDLWIARYNYKYDLSIQRNIWQSSCKGRIDGISENVDLDFGFKDYINISLRELTLLKDIQRITDTGLKIILVGGTAILMELTLLIHGNTSKETGTGLTPMAIW